MSAFLQTYLAASWFDSVIDWLHVFSDRYLTQDTITRLVLSAILILVVFGLRLVVFSIISHRLDDVKRKYHARRFVTYLLTGITIVGLILIWVVSDQDSASSIAEFMGLIGAGLAIAMHDTVSNVTGWIFILWRKPFRVGERIEINGMTGDVIDIRMFEFSMIEVGGDRLSGGGEQSTGRILHIPNGTVLRQQVANFDTGFSHIWDEIGVLITFESDWEKAKEILNDIVNRHVERFSRPAESGIRKAAQKYMIYAGKLTPIVYTSIENSGVMLTLRFMVIPRQRRGVRQHIFEDILREFNKHEDIDFAYPTIRYFSNPKEGKTGKTVIPEA